jgi:hypothetical protein
MKRKDHAIEIAKALLSNEKYLELYNDDMVGCVNLTRSNMEEIANDAVTLVEMIYDAIDKMD